MYYILYPILYLLSLLPFWILYGISDFVAFILEKVIKYRKEVILSNLHRAFPHYTQQERLKIANTFYHHFTDTFIETIKVLSMSEEDFRKRVSWDTQAFEQPVMEGKNIQISSLHAINWEYGSLAASSYLPISFLAVYKKIGNKAVDDIFKKIRSKYGAIMVETAELGRKMAEYASNQYAIGLIADQNPSNTKSAFWINFLGEPTAFLPGPEMTAKRNDLSVVFTRMKPLQKRGYYHVENKLVVVSGKDLEKGELLKLYVNFIEESIALYPAFYLWSHKRFKHRFEEVYRKNRIDR